MEDREQKLSNVYDELERDLELIGATAIEDKLQEEVGECYELYSSETIYYRGNH